MAISRALKARGKGANVALAELLGVTASNVSQWATGHRPVPPPLAPKVADFLGLEPELVSPGYARIPMRVGEPTGEPYSGHLPPAVQRAPDDITALNMALGVLVATMVRHRPAEAAAYATALRKAAPRGFREIGLIQELLTTLDAVGAPAKRARE